MRFNKKGVIGRVVLSIPVFLVVFFILALFLVGAYYLAGQSGSRLEEASKTYMPLSYDLASLENDEIFSEILFSLRKNAFLDGERVRSKAYFQEALARSYSFLEKEECSYIRIGDFSFRDLYLTNFAGKDSSGNIFQNYNSQDYLFSEELRSYNLVFRTSSGEDLEIGLDYYRGACL